jgi:signal peptidase I
MEATTALTIEAASAAPTAAKAGRRRVGVTRVRHALALAGVACLAGGLAYLGTWPPLAIVQSGSMAPTIGTGDVVVLAQLHRAPRVGDIVAVTVPDEARSRYGYPPLVIHRVVRTAPNGDVTTKGDARKAPDPFTVRRGSLHERVLLAIPGVGRALAFFTSTLGLIWLGLGGMLLVGLPLLERRREEERQERESSAALHSELRSICEELERLRGDAGGRERHVAALVRETAAAREQLADAIELLSATPRPDPPPADPFAELERPDWEGEPPPADVLAPLARPAASAAERPDAGSPHERPGAPTPIRAAPARARRRSGGLLRRLSLYR